MLNRRSLLRRIGGSLPLVAAGAVPAFSASLAAEDRPLIWDVHCHLTSVPGATPEDRMREIVKYLDRMGIDRVMLSLGYPLEYNPSPKQLREENDQVLRAIRYRPTALTVSCI
jgi:hypothetical protein